MSDQPQYRVLPCELSEAEIAEKGKELAQTLNKLDTLELEKQDWIKAWKHRKEPVASEAERLQKIVSDGEEDREVEVKARFVFSSRKVHVYRRDRLAIVETRDMHPHEMQSDLLEEGDQSEDQEIPSELGKRAYKAPEIAVDDGFDEEEAEAKQQDLKDETDAESEDTVESEAKMMHDVDLGFGDENEEIQKEIEKLEESQE